MNTHRVNAAAGVLHASMQLGKSLPAALAYDLEVAGLLQSPETAAELSRLVDDRAQWQRRYYEESRTYWDAELPPGGECCADCGQPVESEPCPEHHPATVAARLAEENERLRARVAELETDLNARGEDLTAAVAGWGRSRDRVAELESANGRLVAERDAQIIAWLGKKAREYGTSNREARDKAEAVSRMADKLSRGAVRPLEDPHDGPLHHAYTKGRDLPEVPSV